MVYSLGPPSVRREVAVAPKEGATGTTMCAVGRHLAPSAAQKALENVCHVAGIVKKNAATLSSWHAQCFEGEEASSSSASALNCFGARDLFFTNEELAAKKKESSAIVFGSLDRDTGPICLQVVNRGHYGYRRDKPSVTHVLP